MSAKARMLLYFTPILLFIGWMLAVLGQHRLFGEDFLWRVPCLSVVALLNALVQMWMVKKMIFAYHVLAQQFSVTLCMHLVRISILPVLCHICSFLLLLFIMTDSLEEWLLHYLLFEALPMTVIGQRKKDDEEELETNPS